MLSNAHFLAKFRFGTAENEPAKNLQILIFATNCNYFVPILPIEALTPARERYADYVTLNVSCPNTREGKTFEDPAALDGLLGRVPRSS